MASLLRRAKAVCPLIVAATLMLLAAVSWGQLPPAEEPDFVPSFTGESIPDAPFGVQRASYDEEQASLSDAGATQRSPLDLPPPPSELPSVAGRMPGTVVGEPSTASRKTFLGPWDSPPVDETNAADDDAGRPTFRLGGQLQIDAIWFGQDAASRAAVGDIQDALDFRRARLTGQGQAYDVFNYAIGFDFALGTRDVGRPQFLDNFVGVTGLPYVGNFRVGHFFEPFSLERLTLNRYHTFMERSLDDAFAPSRNVGIMIFDQFADERGTWAVGTFRSGGDTFGDDVGDQEGQALTGRATWLPYYEAEGRAYLHLGGAYSFRDAADGRVRYQSRPEIFGHSDTEGIYTPFFVDTGFVPAESSQLFGGELLWVRGPFSVQSEYMLVPVEREAGADPFFHGAYIYASYFLTGEHRPYNRQTGTLDRVLPFENFFRVRTEQGPVVTGRGAWEVALRLSYIDLTDAGVNGGELTDWTLGLNWYLTPYHRIKWNYIHSHLDRAPFGDSDAVIFGMRFDMDF